VVRERVVRETLASRNMPIEEPLCYAIEESSDEELELLYQVLEAQWRNDDRWAREEHPVMLDADMNECVASPPFPYKATDRAMAPARRLDPQRAKAKKEAIEMGLAWGILKRVPRDKRVRFVVNEVFAPTSNNELRWCLAPGSNYVSRYNALVHYPSERERWIGRSPRDVFFVDSDDARKAFWTVRFDELWREYATVRDGEGGYVEADRMMFGFDFAPSIYDAFMQGIFERAPFEHRMERMVDNMVLLGRKDELRAYLLDLLAYYALCDKHRIPLKAERQFMRAQTTVLGRQLGYLGTLEATEISIKRVVDVNTKFEGATQVRGAVGIALWLEPFCIGLKEALGPFYELVKPGVVWEDVYDHAKYEQAWRNLLRVMAKHLVVTRLVDPELDVATFHDASTTAWSTFVVQPDQPCKTWATSPPTKFYIIRFFSRSLTKHQRKWSPTDLELTSTVHGCGEARMEIQRGREHYIYSDHEPLAALHRTQLWNHLSPRQQRCLMLIHGLCANWVYWKGERNNAADFGTRFKLCHEPDGSKLIPKWRQDPEFATVAPVDVTAKLPAAAEPVATAFPAATECGNRERRYESYAFKIKDISTGGQRQAIAKAYNTLLVDVAGEPLDQPNDTDLAMNLPVSLLKTTAADPVTQVIISLVDKTPLPADRYAAADVKTGTQIYEKYKDGWFTGGRTTAGTRSLFYQGEEDFWPRRWIPEALRRLYTAQYHNTLSGAHPGAEETRRQMRRTLFWDNNDGRQEMMDVIDWVKECMPCQLGKPGGTRLNFKHGDPFPVTTPFEITQVDLVGPFTETPRGNKYIASFTDYATKFGAGDATKTKKVAEVARLYVFNVALVYGCSRLFVTDMGKEWVNDLMDEICRLLGVARHTTAADDSAGVAADERAHLEIENALRALHVGDAWDEAFPVVRFARNMRYTKPNGGTRFEHFFGRPVFNPVDAQLVALALLETEKVALGRSVQYWADSLAKNTEQRETIRRVKALQDQKIWDAQRGKGDRQEPLKLGEMIALRARPAKTAISGNKLEPLWVGPFKIKTLSPNKLQITAEFVHDPSIVVARHARQWKRLIRGEDDDLFLEPSRYVVEDVIDARGPSEDRQYLVSWLGYPEEFNTWEARTAFDAGSLYLVELADKRWPPADVLAETAEPLPLAPTETPSWAAELRPENIERYVDVKMSRRGGAVLRMVVKPEAGKKAKSAHLRERTLAVSLLPPAIREEPTVAKMIADAERR